MRKNQHTRADRTRDRILRAAIREFSEHGLAGARTSAIASAARVNKALLYYYFRDKEALYTAALEEVAGKVAGDAIAVLDLGCSPGERPAAFRPQPLPPWISVPYATGDGSLPHRPVACHAHHREERL